GVVIAKIKGITDRNGAEALKGTELFMDRSQLPEPEDEETFYHADLIGLDAFDEAGALLGRVTAVFDHGAGDVIDIRMAADGRLITLPFTKAVVPVVDIAAKRIEINMPDGMLSDDKEARKAETKAQQAQAAGEKQ
ncbi:MAG: ribosome maturation factor RimM, partial [Cohaesibacter sp.]|nr:ribosome maturation factor RimM [Cohaesibacter sp.]